MHKTIITTLFLGVVAYLAIAETPEFSAIFNVTWDKDSLAWRVNKDVSSELNIAGDKIALFNVSSGSGSDVFFISPNQCSQGARYASSRKDGVTNNACTPPCVVAMKVQSGSFFYCSSIFPETSTGLIFVQNCDECSKKFCSKTIGCGYNGEEKKCVDCLSATSEEDCQKLSACSWCETDGICLHKDSGACRSIVARDRPVPSWVWLVITLIALTALVIVFLTLFLKEASFKKRWESLAKTDKDYAEVGRGNTDGLFATD